jgi:hypothetical protein
MLARQGSTFPPPQDHSLFENEFINENSFRKDRSFRSSLWCEYCEEKRQYDIIVFNDDDHGNAWLIG